MNMQNIPGGKLSLICGPMFSGKSRELINVIKRYAYKKKKIVMVKFNLDNRYSEESKVVTHEKQEFPALRCTQISEVYNTLLESEVIGIDEGQFYGDIVDAAEKLTLSGKIVIISALSGTFKMEPFENVSRLIAKADKVKHLKAVCNYCPNKAAFSLRTVRGDQEVLIGAADLYQPVCKICYYQNLPNEER